MSTGAIELTAEGDAVGFYPSDWQNVVDTARANGWRDREVRCIAYVDLDDPAQLTAPQAGRLADALKRAGAEDEMAAAVAALCRRGAVQIAFIPW